MHDAIDEPAGAAQAASPSGGHWYACQVMARAEKKVAQLLGQSGFESFLPLMKSKRAWKDRMKVVELPLFTGYVFARFPLERYGAVLRIPRLATVVRVNQTPAAIPDEEIENLRRFAERLDRADVEPDSVHELVKGERVRILAEPFGGAVEGTVLDLRRGARVDVYVGVELIGQYVRIKVRAEELEPAGHSG